VISRRRKIIFIQVSIFLFASSLLYNTYRDRDKKNIELVKIESESNPDTNSFNDVEYSGFDLNGNRYTLQARTVDFKTSTPEDINMKKVIANFYLEDDTVLKITSDIGFYNNTTFDMDFRENVVAKYLDNTLLSDQLIYSNTKGKLQASGNVRGESLEKGEFFADNVEYNLTNKILNFSMFDDKQVNIKLKN
jgi:hypothetical protein